MDRLRLRRAGEGGPVPLWPAAIHPLKYFTNKEARAAS